MSKPGKVKTNPVVAALYAFMNQPTTVDFCQFAIDELGPLRPMKLHKLAYFAYGFGLAHDVTVFKSNFRGWDYGPVCRIFWDKVQGIGNPVPAIDGAHPTLFTRPQAELLNRVLKRYGHLSGEELSDLTHAHTPWRDAWNAGRGGILKPDEKIDDTQLEAFFKRLILDKDEDSPFWTFVKIPSDSPTAGQDLLAWISEQMPSDIESALGLFGENEFLDRPEIATSLVIAMQSRTELDDEMRSFKKRALGWSESAYPQSTWISNVFTE